MCISTENCTSFPFVQFPLAAETLSLLWYPTKKKKSQTTKNVLKTFKCILFSVRYRVHNTLHMRAFIYVMLYEQRLRMHRHKNETNERYTFLQKKSCLALLYVNGSITILYII